MDTQLVLSVALDTLAYRPELGLSFTDWRHLGCVCKVAARSFGAARRYFLGRLRDCLQVILGVAPSSLHAFFYDSLVASILDPAKPTSYLLYCTALASRVKDNTMVLQQAGWYMQEVPRRNRITHPVARTWMLANRQGGTICLTSVMNGTGPGQPMTLQRALVEADYVYDTHRGRLVARS